MWNLQAINTFLLLAEYKSFVGVAAKLNLSVTAVSKQIKTFEQELGEQLFVRTTRKVNLTDFGASLLQHCQALVDKIDDIDSFIVSQKIVPQGKLDIVCSQTTGKKLLLEHLPEFSARYPKINLNIEFQENTTGRQIEFGDIHFAYATHEGVTDDMRSRYLFTLRHMLCASPEYLEKNSPIKTAKDLMQHKIVNLDLRAQDHFRLSSNKKINLPTPYLVMNSFEALMQSCIDGMGVMLTVDRYTQPYLESGALVPVLPALAYRELDIYLFYRAMKYELPKVRAFVDFYSEKIVG